MVCNRPVCQLLIVVNNEGGGRAFRYSWLAPALFWPAVRVPLMRKPPAAKICAAAAPSAAAIPAAAYLLYKFATSGQAIEHFPFTVVY
jgi:hypothetical protein